MAIWPCRFFYAPFAGRFPIRLKFQNIAGLAFQHLADRRERGKADGRYFVILDFREVDIRDADPLGKLAQRYFSLNHHSIQPQYNFSHLHASLQQSVHIFFQLHPVREKLRQAKHDDAHHKSLHAVAHFRRFRPEHQAGNDIHD